MEQIIYIISDFSFVLRDNLFNRLKNKLFFKSIKVKTKKELQIILDAITEDDIIFYGFNNCFLQRKVENSLANTEIIYINFLNFKLENLALVFKQVNEINLSSHLGYFDKIKAIEFSLLADDRYDWNKLKKADIILLGLSCTAKTPLALYLGFQGYKVANLPLVPEITLDFTRLKDYKEKIVALTADAKLLSQYRKEKLIDLGIDFSCSYIDHNRINEEIKYFQKVIKLLQCPVLDIEDKKIELLALEVIKLLT
mgnify:CR=1 FL=1